ncbi:13097_t:CDS:2 [Ambispora gerdemannii]|uniref:13097_t:CDS:1 n=1 Tax=Ambispora gerdemannii TaxID=144530 RepID=A0A9N8ZDS6_9GLOM|nr:13097_t:CDS:2 [Ambispora gerdemannii]
MASIFTTNPNTSLRFVRTESVSQTPPVGPENISQLKAKLDPLFAAHKELSDRVDNLLKKNNEKLPSDSDDNVLHLAVQESTETLKGVIWSLNSTKKFVENAESNLELFHNRLPLTKSEIAREYYHVRLDQYSYYCDNLFPVNFESNQSSLERVRQGLNKIERAIAIKSGQMNVEIGQQQQQQQSEVVMANTQEQQQETAAPSQIVQNIEGQRKLKDVLGVAQEQGEKPKEAEASQKQIEKETSNIQTQGQIPSAPTPTNIATQQQIKPQTPPRNTRATIQQQKTSTTQNSPQNQQTTPPPRHTASITGNKVSPPANFSQMSPAQQAAFLRRSLNAKGKSTVAAVTAKTTPVNAQTPSGQQQKTPVTKRTPTSATGKIPNFPTPSGQQATATPVRTTTNTGKSPKTLGKPATLVTPVIAETSQQSSSSINTAISTQEPPIIVILSPDSPQVQQQPPTLPQMTLLIEEIPENAPKIEHMQIDQPEIIEAASPAPTTEPQTNPDLMDVDESKTTKDNNDNNELIIEILETSEFPSSSAINQQPELIIEQPPSENVTGEQNQ